VSSRERHRVAVSLRVDVALGHGERRDGLAHDWYACFARWGITPILVPNAAPASVSWLDELSIDAVLLTGGNTPVTADMVPDDAAPERDAVEDALLAFARDRGLPLLGVCRGAQFLATRFGARLIEADGHVARDHAVTWRHGRHAHRATTNSFHGWALDSASFPDALRILATADDGTVEAFEHVDEAIAGVLWHPERPGSEDPVLAAFVDDFFAPRATSEVV